MTGWDFLYAFIEKGGLAWTLLLVALCGIIWLIAHPQVVKEWNVQISMWIANIVPQKRKRAFEKRLNLTIDSAKTKFSESAPLFMQKFLPYDLKVTWVGDYDTIESVLDDKQIIIYVPSYKNEAKQAVGVLHSYCSEGFAQKAKLYMPLNARKASDLVITQKLAQHAGHNIYDYFSREYLPEILKEDGSYRDIFEKLQKVDRDGLFIPILLNEIDKYANKIYPSPSSPETMNIIIHLMNFIYKIVVRETGDLVPLTFCEDEIKIKIILAISDSTGDINIPIKEAEYAIQNQKVNTVYILATGSKIDFAKDIAKKIYERNPQDIFDPVETNYKRYTRRPSGKESVCIEINTR